MLAKDPSSPPARVLQLARTGSLTVLVSAELIEECRDALLRDRIRSRHGKTPQEIEQVLDELKAHAEIVDVPAGASEGPDPDDAFLWRLLKTRTNAVLITGDRALLEHGPAWATVMTARAWLESH
jgi:putative PIN family toxin of toxin-antitoxin system